ncbi:MAG: hypothetical protein GY870_10515 [archaeon]|nr:hypothetical protein [archaeon]
MKDRMNKKTTTKIKGERKKFSATFQRVDKKEGPLGYWTRHLVFIELKDGKNDFLKDEIWMSYSKGFTSLNMKSGDIISFSAAIIIFENEEDDSEFDFKLQRPTKAKIIGHSDGDFEEYDKQNEELLELISEHNDKIAGSRIKKKVDKEEENELEEKNKEVKQESKRESKQDLKHVVKQDLSKKGLDRWL